MGAFPRPTRNAMARSHSPADPNHGTDDVYTNGSYLNPQISELYRLKKFVSPNKSDTESMPSSTDNDGHINRTPLANPQMTVVSDVKQIGKQPEIDNGFFSNRENEDEPVLTDVENGRPSSLFATENAIDENNRLFHKRPITPYNINSGGPFSRPTFLDVELSTNSESLPDINIYQHKKTLAQGMMDIALFSCNINQLRYVLDSDMHPYYYTGIVLITISLIFQVAIAVGLIWNSRYNVKDKKEICIANKINNFTVIGTFLVTVNKICICTFSVTSVQTIVAP